MSSEALEAMRQTIWVAIGHPANYSEGAPNCPGCKAEAALAALLAEVARLEQERDTAFEDGLRIARDGLAEHLTANGLDDRLRRAEAALAVAREREQRAVEALRDAEAFTREAYDYGCAWPIGLDTDPQEQRGQARDTFIRNAEFVGGIARAALVDEPAADRCDGSPTCTAAEHVENCVAGWATGPEPPAAATLAEPGRSRRDPPAVVDGEASLPGSASAAADDGRCPGCGWYVADCNCVVRAAADEPGETPCR